VRDLACGDMRIHLDVEVRRVGLPALWHGEAGAARLPGGQSLLHEALRLL
jgi:transposase